MLPRTKVEAPHLGSHWQELVTEGRVYQTAEKLPLAVKLYDQAIDSPSGCGWQAYQHRAACHLELLESEKALEDAQQAVENYLNEGDGQVFRRVAPSVITAIDVLHREAELEEGLLLACKLDHRRHCPDKSKLVSDPIFQRQDGLKSDIRKALGKSAGRVLRRDLVRAMLRKKGIDLNHPSRSPKGDWIGVQYGKKQPAWRKLVSSENYDEETAWPLPQIWQSKSMWMDHSKSDEDEKDGDPRPWGLMRQIPGHNHICADPMVAIQAARVAEMKELGVLENERAYLRKLIMRLKLSKHGYEDTDESPEIQRRGRSTTTAGYVRAQKFTASWLEPNQQFDALEQSNINAESSAQVMLDRLDKLVKSQLRVRARYLKLCDPKSKSNKQRVAMYERRRHCVHTTAQFMLRRMLKCLAQKEYRDVDCVAERLIKYLEHIPCSLFEDRYLALARALDCRAVAVLHKDRGGSDTALAIQLQKRRCEIGANHAIPELYARALDELALLLFSECDYPMAMTSWTERLSLLKTPEERCQTLFQIARCCFLEGAIRSAGNRGSSNTHRDISTTFLPLMMRRDHRLSIDSSIRKSRSHLRHSKVAMADVDFPKERCSMLNIVPDDEEEQKDTLGVTPNGDELQSLKPINLESCLRMIMDEMQTQEPLVKCIDLLFMERYPISGDSEQQYPLMPPDFEPRMNIMNNEYKLFEDRFVGACQFIVADITGNRRTPSLESESETETESSESENEGNDKKQEVFTYQDESSVFSQPEMVSPQKEIVQQKEGALQEEGAHQDDAAAHQEEVTHQQEVTHQEEFAQQEDAEEAETQDPTESMPPDH